MSQTKTADAPARLDTLFDYQRRWSDMARAANQFGIAATCYQALNAATYWGSWMSYSSEHPADAFRDPVEFVNNALSEVNTAMLKLQHSDEFMKAQKALVKGIGNLGATHRDVSEIWQAWNHVPTQRDVDDISRTVHELRREVRRLRRQLGVAGPSAAAARELRVQ